MEWNDIGPDGAAHVADALKSNSSLRELKCATCLLPYLAIPLMRNAIKRQQPVTLPDLADTLAFPDLPGSVGFNQLGAEGAKAFADMLTINNTLTSVEYAASSTGPTVALFGKR